MNPNRITEAVKEAERFLLRVEELRNSEETEVWGGPHHAAVRRASLDLTRALARMRSRET